MNVSAVSSGRSTQLLQRVMRQADSDASGGISSAELTKVSGSNAASSDVTALFKGLDGSRDGQISGSELKTAFDNMSTEMQSALLSVQEDANSVEATSDDMKSADAASDDTAAADALKALADSASANAGIAGMTTNGTQTQGEPPAEGARPAPPAGGGGKGGGGKADDAETDPADANEDGVVSPSEQAAYDASQGAAAATSTATASSATEEAGTGSAKSAATASATKALAAKSAYASLMA